MPSLTKRTKGLDGTSITGVLVELAWLKIYVWLKSTSLKTQISLALVVPSILLYLLQAIVSMHAEYWPWRSIRLPIHYRTMLMSMCEIEQTVGSVPAGHTLECRDVQSSVTTGRTSGCTLVLMRSMMMPRVVTLPVVVPMCR